MNLGIDELLHDPFNRTGLKGKRVAFLGHGASVTRNCIHSLDALMECDDIRIVSAFGPQHGMYTEKQDNMVESDDFIHPLYRFPVFSLYGTLRRPSPEMTDTFEIILVDLQDIGARTYSYITTLFYLMEACAEQGKSLWVLDRPNPIGRPVEGSILEPGWESFIGPAPLVMRHGLTIGEMAQWYADTKELDLDLRIIRMKNYHPDAGPGFGWPVYELPWINPSPNASSLNMTRCFPGTALIEGTLLSEGRGTTTSLELIGSPNLDFQQVLKQMHSFAPQWLTGCSLRVCTFEPTYDKHLGMTCSGIQIHTDTHLYRHKEFRPYRIVSACLKSIRTLYPDLTLWHDQPFEYETGKLAIDLLSGGAFLRTWVDDPDARPSDLDDRLWKDETEWSHTRESFLLY